MRDWLREDGGSFGAAMGKLEFEDADVSPPLQAAEMVAWHIRDHADSKSIGQPTHRPVAEILWTVPTVTKAWDGQAMDDFVTI